MILRNMCYDTGEEIAIYLNPLLKHEFDWTALIIGLVGVFVGGLITYIANVGLELNKRKNQEKTTVISLTEELKAIMECYQSEFEALFTTLEQQNYLTTTYTISQDYFTVYKSNVDKLGLIESEELRNLFIKIHIELNRLIENLVIYKEQYQNLCERHSAFLAYLNPNLINPKLLKGFDVSQIIKDVQHNPKKYIQENIDVDEKAWHVINFFSNNEIEQGNLHNKSVELAKIFETIERLYAQIMDIVNEKYNKEIFLKNRKFSKLPQSKKWK